ncbi:hypothetical protein [Stygiolobus caldivivus]|uniref:DUF2721 domain-containing protein n=1 Tax=Stygiolobus caldivivus TaxID=2824673 RepID=A0A8D5ZIL2_9CREN|nr:hypothetical protein [Stygiolobus caldivivus]BCU69721.1 hypothetical protein KN1_10180 [Stygiolobus caldivivus]
MNFIVFYLILAVGLSLLSASFYLSTRMDKLSELLLTKVKNELSLRFIEESENFIVNGELTNLIQEILIYFENFKSIGIDDLSNKIFERSDKIKNEIEYILYIIMFINRIYTYSQELKRNSALTKILSILVVILGIVNGIIVQLGYSFIIPVILISTSISILIGILFEIFGTWYRINKSVEKLTRHLENNKN